MQLMVFSKHLIDAPLAETARRLRAMGIEAIDLTVRPGGHVEPERVADELPRVQQTLAAGGVRIGMMTTAINATDEPYTEAILHTAAQLGIGFYKLGYYIYEGFGSLRRQREELAAQWRDLAALNGQYGIRGGFHNHSGNNVGASAWDIAWALDKVDSPWLGSYFDGMHATAEGGRSGWLQALDILRERIIMLAVKDFRWRENPAGHGPQELELVPVGQGNVRWPQILRHLQESGFDGPVSLHSEYQGASSWRDLTTDEVFTQTARDVEVFRQWWQAARENSA